MFPPPPNAAAEEEPPEEGGDDDDDDDDDDEESFFESFDRIPSSVTFDLCAASSSSDAEEDARMSFASAIGNPADFSRLNSIADLSAVVIDEEEDDDDEEDYTVWMAEPMSIEERRRRLLKGMGLSESRRSGFTGSPKSGTRGPHLLPPSVTEDGAPGSNSPQPSPSALVRSRSDTSVAIESRVRRTELFLGARQVLPRASSVPPGSNIKMSTAIFRRRTLSRRRTRKEGAESGSNEGSGATIGRGLVSRVHSRRNDPVAFYTIKNLDTGKEFVINLENGAWNSRLSDLQTGVQITMEEFEKSVGHSPIVRELLRRQCVGPEGGGNGPGPGGASMKSASKRKGVGWLKNIRGVANSVTGLVLEREGSSLVDRFSGRSASMASSATAAAAAASTSDWMKVHRRGKPYKELTGLYMSQEIQAHQGSIWCMRFSEDAQYLASAGEDRAIHVWQVLECDTMSSSQRPLDEPNATPQHPMASGSPGSSARLDIQPSGKMKRGKSSRRKSSIPEHVVVPEAIFSLSDKPVCSFQGHLDDVLDLSWSKSQYLLSSSMDKTVRLWDMETKACLKLFAHNDYVTCIQFNPVDDRYFISGSLDAKVRIWSIPDRQVVEWHDLHEMVTAACYTPDGQGALVGSHKGSCRFYSLTDECKLNQKAQVDIYNKKKKSHAKKITGFQFAPGNPSEVLITSADSQVRIYDGVDLVHKFRGFRNTNSQISSSFTPDGNYVVCASEDSHVYVWKREQPRNGSSGKSKAYVSTRSHENFSCKDVSVAIPWPGSNRYEPPAFPSSRYYHPSPMPSPEHHHSHSASIMSSADDPFSSSRSHCPPLPKKSSADRPLSCTEEELCKPSRTDSAITSSTSYSSSSWLRSGPLSGFGMSSSGLSSRWYIGGSNRSTPPAATAWGLVVVTAGLGGEIKVYQNFGLPLRLNR